ncbi:hypothetical protein [Campylobacter hyointestinalis]|uniref:hypothetical protein n=1 Tax=Campylobacter hyointestinalis TaxID=198 RepID=UPI00215D2A70|nr:hypothetical protein [Campylobacter hyointestinalis]
MVKTSAPPPASHPPTVEKKLSTLVKPVPPAANTTLGISESVIKAEICFKREFVLEELGFSKRALRSPPPQPLGKKKCLSYFGISFIKLTTNYNIFLNKII